MAQDDSPLEVRLLPPGGWDRRLHILRCGSLVDAYVVVTQRYVVLVDTLVGPAAADALWRVAAPQLVGGRTLLVVNTHADWDHCYGNSRFAGPGADYPAPILGHRLAAERLASPEAAAELAALRQQSPERFADLRLTPPTVGFEGHLTIDGGDLTLLLVPTPGHQPDHVSVWIPEIRTVLAGDAAEAPFPSAPSAAALPALRRSLATLIALEPAVALYCHAPESSGPALLAANADYFDQLASRCAAALARGLRPGELSGPGIAAALDFAYADALPPGTSPEDFPDFHAAGHEEHLRRMLEHLAAPAAPGDWPGWRRGL